MLWHCWLGVRKSIRPVTIEWWGVGVVICLEQGADCLHMVQLMPLHPQTASFYASFKSRLVLSFWYRHTQVVLEKRPLNGCSVVVVVVSGFNLFLEFPCQSIWNSLNLIIQTMSPLVNESPGSKLYDGGLQRLHSSDDIAVKWLERMEK